MRIASLLVLVGCTSDFGVAIDVTGEHGEPLSDAVATVDGATFFASGGGRIHLHGLPHPEVAAISAPGHFAEPVPVGRTADGPIAVHLWEDRPGRLVMHNGGDTMLGRRYQAPTSDTPVVKPDDDGSSARAVVSDLAPAFALANLRTVNLETVVGDLPLTDAYPKKRYLLETPPTGLFAVEDLADAVVLSNNHSRDWLDVGVDGTIQALDAEAIPHLGAGVDAPDAATPLVVDAHGEKVGILGFTSITGEVDDQALPGEQAKAPNPVPAGDEWKWDERTWGFEPWVATRPRRIGTAWKVANDAEGTLAPEVSALVFASMEAVYPEIQDWVAGHGHGGAHPWDTATSPAQIAAMRPQVDLEVVQFHMGYQFAEAPATAVRAAARAAIDAGADLVVCHHPHVLQGTEWYHDKLIIYSLGNLVFDQDFLATFPTGFLRTIWDGRNILEARFVPAYLDRYRPIPLADGKAEDVLRHLSELSELEAVTEKNARTSVLYTVGKPRDAGAIPAGFQLDHNTAILLPSSPSPVHRTILVPANSTVELPNDGLVRRRLNGSPDPALLVGRDIAGMGSFEADGTEALDGTALGWTWNSPDVHLTDRYPLDGHDSLEMVRSPTNSSRLEARMRARVGIVPHRMWGDSTGTVPLDGDATWSIRMKSRAYGEIPHATARVALYWFYDLDPTEEPSSTQLAEREVDLPIAHADGVTCADIPPDLMGPVGGVTPNQALLYITLYPPKHSPTAINVDDVQFVEWRPAALEPEGWANLPLLRNTSSLPIEVAYDFLPWAGE